MALSFPSKQPPHWQIVGATPQTTTVTRDGFTTVSVALPTPKKPEMPGDAPCASASRPSSKRRISRPGAKSRK
jgi:hypothetical protein